MNNLLWLALAVGSFTAIEAQAQSVTRVQVVLGDLAQAEGGTAAELAPGPLKNPFGVDFGPQGELWIVELAGGRVHRQTREGALSLISGALDVADYAGDGGPAAGGRFNGMHNVAVSRQGTVYIADTWNHCVRQLADGQITTIAGTGRAGDRGDDGPARAAEFNYVMCVTLDHDERQLYIADLNNRRIRVLDLAAGTVKLVAGNGQRGVPSDGGAASTSPLVDPRAVASDSQGNVYVLERSGHALRVVTPDGAIRTVAGTGKPGRNDGPALAAQLNSPKHLCVDDADRVYIADEGNHLIRRFDPQQQTLTTILGDGHSQPPVRLKQPHGVCIEQGKLYVVDSGNHRVLQVTLPE